MRGSWFLFWRISTVGGAFEQERARGKKKAVRRRAGRCSRGLGHT